MVPVGAKGGRFLKPICSPAAAAKEGFEPETVPRGLATLIGFLKYGYHLSVLL